MKELDPTLTFEEAVERLEALVRAMEDGTLSLDESLARFEEAVALSRYCTGRLEEAERKVAVLTESGGLAPLPAYRETPPDPFEDELL